MKSLFHCSILLISFFLLNFLSAKNSFAQNFNNSQLVTMISKVENGIPDTLDWSASTIDKMKHLIVAGNTKNGNTTDMLLTKYSLTGAIDWYHTYNNFNNSFDYGTAVTTDDSANIYVAGTSLTGGTNGYDYLIRKYDSSGAVKWTLFYNGPGSSYDVATDIKFFNGYVYVTGTSMGSTTGLDYCSIKYNRGGGSPIWASRYDYTSLTDIPASITIASDGNIVVSGGSGSTLTNWDFAVIKYKASSGGDLTTTRSTSSGLGFDQPTSATIDQSGNIYVCGYAGVSGNGYDIKVVKLDTSLHTKWSETWDGSHLDDRATSVGVDALGNVYVTGYTTRVSGGTDYITLKYNADSILQWQERYSANDTTKYARARDLDIDPYGFVIVTGSVFNITNKDFLTLAYDTAGNKMWEEWFDGSGKGDDYASTVRVDTDHVFYVMGRVWSGTAFTYATLKYRTIDFITPPDTEYIPQSLAFYENHGQLLGTNDSLQPKMKYYSTSHFPSVYFQKDTLSFVFAHIDSSASTMDTIHRIDLTFSGSSTTNPYRAGDHVPGYKNFYFPQCSSGATGVRGYRRILYPKLYDNVDLMYSSNSAGLKLYLICKPGFRPTDIEMKFLGANSISILGDTSLKIASSIGSFRFEPAFAYQIDTDGSVINLSSPLYYVSGGTNKINFHFPTYNGSKPLIIEIKRGNGDAPPPSTGGCPSAGDDNKVWSTFFGGDDYETINDIATGDVLNNFYVVGSTHSTEASFPVYGGVIIQATFQGLTDAYIAKFDENYAQVWATYFGGSGYDYASGATVSYSSAGAKLFVVGHASSNITPVNLIGATFNETYQSGGGGFILATDLDGYEKWFTYFNHAWPTKICNEYFGRLFITGSAEGSLTVHSSGVSGEFYDNSYNDGGDAFVAAFTPAGDQVWTTYYGGPSSDDFFDIAYDPLYHRIYCAGSCQELDADYAFTCDPTTAAGNLPICYTGSAFYQHYNSNIGLSDCLIASFSVGSSDNYSIKWATPLGSDGDEGFTGVTTDMDGNCIAIGASDSYSSVLCLVLCSDWNGTNGMPLKGPSHGNYNLYSGGTDLYIAKFDHDDVMTWATYYGAEHGFESWDNQGPSVASINNVTYIVGQCGDGVPADYIPFPASNPTGFYSQTDITDNSDAIIAAFSASDHLVWATYFGGNDDLWYAIGGDYGYVLVPSYDNTQLFFGGEFHAQDASIVEGPYGSYLANPNGGNPIYDDAFLAAFCIPENFTGINEAEASYSKFNIYPNPAINSITVTWDKINNVNKIVLLNELGQNVESIPVSIDQNSVEIDVTNFPAGIFFIQLRGDNINATQNWVHIK